MAITQLNLYLPGQNLTNLAQNSDYNRLNDCKMAITVNFGVSPAEVTVKIGSLIEVNGNLYAIDTADYVFSMDNATHNYLTFTDNPAVDFGSAAAIGTYTAAKQGYYQAGNLIRTLPFYIDQVNKSYVYLIDDNKGGLVPATKKFTHIVVHSTIALTGNTPGEVIKLNIVDHDQLSEWDSVNYQFTCPESGYYFISVGLTISWTANNILLSVLYVKKDAAVIGYDYKQIPANANAFRCNTSIAHHFYLVKSNIIKFTCDTSAIGATSEVNQPYYVMATISRIF